MGKKGEHGDNCRLNKLYLIWEMASVSGDTLPIEQARTGLAELLIRYSKNVFFVRCQLKYEIIQFVVVSEEPRFAVKTWKSRIHRRTIASKRKREWMNIEHARIICRHYDASSDHSFYTFSLRINHKLVFDSIDIGPLEKTMRTHCIMSRTILFFFSFYSLQSALLNVCSICWPRLRHRIHGAILHMFYNH